MHLQTGDKSCARKGAGSIYDKYADYLQIHLSGEGNKQVQHNVGKFLV
jgi:hypothetical protein